MVEMELYSHMNDEEFELIRLTKKERRQEILKNIHVCILDTLMSFGLTV